MVNIFYWSHLANTRIQNVLQLVHSSFGNISHLEVIISLLLVRNVIAAVDFIRWLVTNFKVHYRHLLDWSVMRLRRCSRMFPLVDMNEEVQLRVQLFVFSKLERVKL